MTTSGIANEEALSAALLLQQRLAAGSSALGPKSFAGAGLDSSPAVEAILKNQEDQITMAQLLLQKRQADAAAANPLLQRQMLLGGVGGGSVGNTGPSMGSIKRTLDEALSILQTSENAGAISKRSSLLGMSPPAQVSSLLGGNNVSSLSQPRETAVENPNLAKQSVPNAISEGEKAEGNNDSKQTANKNQMDEVDDTQNKEEEEEEEDDDTYYNDSNNEKDKNSQDARNSNETFPLKLYRMLIEAEKNDQSEIVSFFPHNRAFAIHKPRDFVTEIMPKYFTTGRMSSFQRQLNLYGFKRITEGRDKGGYYHEHFLKGRRSLCKKIKRKRTSVKAPPNFFNDQNPLADAQQLFGTTAAAGAVAAGGLAGGPLGALQFGDASSALLDLSRQGLFNQVATASTNNVGTGSLLDLSRHGLLSQSSGTNDLLSGLTGAHSPSVGQLQQELLLHQMRQRQLQQELLLRGSIKP